MIVSPCFVCLRQLRTSNLPATTQVLKSHIDQWTPRTRAGLLELPRAAPAMEKQDGFRVSGFGFRVPLGNHAPHAGVQAASNSSVSEHGQTSQKLRFQSAKNCIAFMADSLPGRGGGLMRAGRGRPETRDSIYIQLGHIHVCICIYICAMCTWTHARIPYIYKYTHVSLHAVVDTYIRTYLHSCIRHA